MGVYRNRSRLGREIRIGVQCRNASRTPSAPDAAPAYRIYSEAAGAAVVTGSLPPTERYTATGLFEYMQRLTSAFATGRYYVRYTYAVSSTQFVDFDSFEVTAGGDVSGMVNSMFFLDRPDSDWIVATLDSGTVTINRGPKL